MSKKPPSLHVVAKEKLSVGTETEILGESHKGRYATVFEDDGETGYFYALDAEKSDNMICDAMHIYNVKNVIDGLIPSTVEIVWSDDGLKSALLLNDYFHAVFDFSVKRGYCRTNFPPPGLSWTQYSHEWDDEALELFK